MTDLESLVRELDATRDTFWAAVGDADPAVLTVPGLVGDWSARELVAHLAHWDDWASTCLEAAARGRLGDVASDTWDVDAQNAAVALEAGTQPMSAIRDREEDSYRRFVDRLSALDAEMLSVPAPWGGTVETIVRENGPDHYAEHAEHVRAWLAAGTDVDEGAGQERQPDEAARG